MKSCSRCGADKPLDQFGTRGGRPHAQSWCKSCRSEYNKSAYRENRQDRIEAQRRYNDLNRDRINQAMTRRRDSWSEKERAAAAEYLREWRKENADKVETYRRDTRAKRKKAFVERVPFEAIWNRDEGVCQLCGKELDRDVAFPDWGSATLDHIIPLSRGGMHEMANVQLACWRCNWQKRDRILDPKEASV